MPWHACRILLLTFGGNVFAWREWASTFLQLQTSCGLLSGPRRWSWRNNRKQEWIHKNYHYQGDCQGRHGKTLGWWAAEGVGFKIDVWTNCRCVGCWHYEWGQIYQVNYVLGITWNYRLTYRLLTPNNFYWTLEGTMASLFFKILEIIFVMTFANF